MSKHDILICLVYAAGVALISGLAVYLGSVF